MRRATVLLTISLVLATALAGCLESFASNSAPVAMMNASPAGTVKVGDTVTFDASSSYDPDVADTLTFDWDFGDGNVQPAGNPGQYKNVQHVYNTKNTDGYTVTLEVSDGDLVATTTTIVIVADAAAALPTASIIHYKNDDCTGENPPAGTFILAWICEEEMETSDDTVDSMTTIQLDGSDSSAGDSSSYLTDYKWDLDLNDDSDGDGDMTNDADKTGENAEWTNVLPGEYEIRLTVTDNQGFTDTMDMDVFVNYRGEWSEFTIDGNGTSVGSVTFEYPITYNQDTGNTIRYVKIQFTYPKQDDDWVVGGGDNTLDAYVFNGTQSDSDTEEVANTTYLDDESRTAGDCSDDDRCVELRLSTQHFRNYLDGQWTVDLVNENAWDTTVKSFVIILEYK
ncbi:MAG: PKD domain-containing protein [Candidatus Thermoplasmatota archaeon]|nr:PKD domain-containing protein [Candidatus Thermoplasmatota archaeon]